MGAHSLSIDRKTHRVVSGFGKVIDTIFKVFLIVIFAFPFLWMFVTSFKTYRESVQSPPTLIIQEPTIQGFKTALQMQPFGIYFRNSVIIVGSVMLLQFLVYIPTAYIFARYKFKGRDLLFGLVLISMMTPEQLTFVPTYIMFSKVHLTNTLWPMILPWIANTFGIFLVRQRFMQIDEEIVEAARLDNAGEFKILYGIMVPIAKPTIVTTTLFSFINNWNSYFWPLVMTNAKEMRPMTIGVALLRSGEGALNMPAVMAGNILLVLPILVIYLFTHKTILSSLGYSGIK